jgi:hypothetical protein
MEVGLSEKWVAYPKKVENSVLWIRQQIQPLLTEFKDVCFKF